MSILLLQSTIFPLLTNCLSMSLSAKVVMHRLEVSFTRSLNQLMTVTSLANCLSPVVNMEIYRPMKDRHTGMAATMAVSVLMKLWLSGCAAGFDQFGVVNSGLPLSSTRLQAPLSGRMITFPLFICLILFSRWMIGRSSAPTSDSAASLTITYHDTRFSNSSNWLYFHIVIP
jgi:hypothetical protein